MCDLTKDIPLESTGCCGFSLLEHMLVGFCTDEIQPNGSKRHFSRDCATH